MIRKNGFILKLWGNFGQFGVLKGCWGSESAFKDVWFGRKRAEITENWLIMFKSVSYCL